MVVLKLRVGGAISPCKWCSGGGIHTRYCETCGRPTLFFNEKILCDYMEFRPTPLEERVEYPSFSDFEMDTDIFGSSEASAEGMANIGTDEQFPVQSGIDDEDDGELPF